MCYVLSVSMYVHHEWTSAHGGEKRVPGSLTGVRESFKPPGDTENITPGPLQGQCAVLTTETSVQLQVFKHFQWPSVPDGLRIWEDSTLLFFGIPPTPNSLNSILNVVCSWNEFLLFLCVLWARLTCDTLSYWWHFNKKKTGQHVSIWSLQGFK